MSEQKQGPCPGCGEYPGKYSGWHEHAFGVGLGYRHNTGRGWLQCPGKQKEEAPPARTDAYALNEADKRFAVLDEHDVSTMEEVRKLEAELHRGEVSLAVLKGDIYDLTTENAVQKQRIVELEASRNEFLDEYNMRGEMLRGREKHIAELEAELAELSERNRNNVGCADMQIAHLGREVARLLEKNEALEASRNEFLDGYNARGGMLRERETHIAELEASWVSPLPEGQALWIGPEAGPPHVGRNLHIFDPIVMRADNPDHQAGNSCHVLGGACAFKRYEAPKADQGMDKILIMPDGSASPYSDNFMAEFKADLDTADAVLNEEQVSEREGVRHGRARSSERTAEGD